MGRGSSKAGGGSPGTSGRKTQIGYLEKNIWGGSGKAMQPTKIQVGDRIDGIQYHFNDDSITPAQTRGVWHGSYNGVKMTVGADNNFVVTSIKKGKTSTEITADRLGGASGITVKKKIPNDMYLRVFKKNSTK